MAVPTASTPYPASDMSDREGAIRAPLLPPPKPGGRPRQVDLRRILNGISHVLRSGCQWRLLPHDGPDPRSAGGGLLACLSGLLPLALECPRCVDPRALGRGSAPCRPCRRLEVV
jgi:hypothetical protein